MPVGILWNLQFQCKFSNLLLKLNFICLFFLSFFLRKRLRKRYAHDLRHSRERVCLHTKKLPPDYESKVAAPKKYVKLSDFPTYCRGTKNGSRCAIQSAYEELCLAFEDGKHLFVVASLDRFHDEVSSLDQSSKENEGFW